MSSDDFFVAAEAAGRPFRLSDGTAVELPLCGYEGEMMLATFTVSAAKARSLIPAADLRPLRLTPGRALLFIVALEYRRKSIGPYREFMIVIPVQLGHRADIPLLPALLQERWPGFGIYLTHIGVTTEIARIVGWELLGFPKFIARTSYDEQPTWRSCTVTEGGCTLFSLAVQKPRRLRQREHGFEVYSLSPFDGRLYTVPYKNRMRVGTRYGRRSARLDLGNHPLVDELQALDLAPAPLAARYATDFCLITQVPPEPKPVRDWNDPRYIYRRQAAGSTESAA